MTRQPTGPDAGADDDDPPVAAGRRNNGQLSRSMILQTALAIVDRGRVVAEGTPEALKAGLEGDAVVVELDGASANGNLDAALSSVTGLREVKVVDDGRMLHARADDGARAVPAVLAALDSHAIPVASVKVARPSLDDVYLRYAGRSFAAAEAADAPKEESK